MSEVMAQMGDAQIRRLPVVDRDKRLAGILSLGDIAVKTDDKKVASVLQDISEPATPDRSGISAASGSAGGGSTPSAPSRGPA